MILPKDIMNKTKELSATWDIESEEAMDVMAKAMAEEIDFQVLSDILVESGWTKVVIKPLTWENGLDIDGWVAEHVKGRFETMGLVWVFEDSKDANWFTLRWLS